MLGEPLFLPVHNLHTSKLYIQSQGMCTIYILWFIERCCIFTGRQVGYTSYVYDWSRKYISRDSNEKNMSFALSACTYLCIVVSSTYCVVFLFCLSSSCVPNVASFSGLSIFDCSIGIL